MTPTPKQLAELVRSFQALRAPLAQDGVFGPKTAAALDDVIAHREAAAAKVRAVIAPPTIQAMGTARPLACWPLRLEHGRAPQVTSGHSSVNPSRPKHHGCDLFYRYDAAIDEPVYAAAHNGAKIPTNDPLGGANGGAAASHGVAKWWVPDGTHAIAAASGRVVSAHDSGTGHMVWIDIGGGLMIGYFHLSSLLVARGDVVVAGDPVGIVGDSTAKGSDARHLHFEIYRGKCNAAGTAVIGYPSGTINPEPYLKGLAVLPAL